ncbi:hypothetical protein ACS0TY_009569 [Phlomoides rotata]
MVRLQPHMQRRSLFSVRLHIIACVRKGWKTDNGFKPGYRLKLEHIMLKSIPNTYIHATPTSTRKSLCGKEVMGP